MKAIVAAFLLCLPLSSAGADTEKEIRAPLKHVTLYPDRAQLTHEGVVEINSGQTLVMLKGLSPYIDPQSLQVKGQGEFTILSVNHQNNFLQNLEELPEVKTIRAQISTLETKVEDEKAAISVLKEKEAFLVANRAVLVSEKSFTLEQFKALMELYTTSMEQVSTTILKKNRLISDYEKQISALKQQIAEKTGKPALPSGEVSVLVSADKALTARLIFSYVSSNTGWYPSYDIRVDDITKPVNILYKANLYQNTGTQWKDVRLSFSNARPWLSGNIPVLYPWFIDFYMPMPAISRSRNLSRADAPIMMEVASEAPSMAKAADALSVEVAKQVGETSITFDVAVPYTINSDGKIQTIEIQRSSSPAEYKYVTVPKSSGSAFLTGNITGWAEQSLQSGEALLYFENTYVGKSFIDVNQATDTLALSLGTDNSIVVKREKRQDFTSKRVLGANKTETYSFLISVRNNKTSVIKITVNDQIPVSSNSSISVEAVELSGGKLNQQTGQIRWDLELKPQETKQLILTYSVRYPKDRTVILE